MEQSCMCPALRDRQLADHPRKIGKPGPFKTWTFQNLDFSKPGPFKTWTFQNLDLCAGRGLHTPVQILLLTKINMKAYLN